MIQFKKLKYKNFLSVGNNGVEYDFVEGQTYLIQGKNGGGKSTVIDALTFALYGKPFRKINKPQLVNSINQKHCEVEVEFETRGYRYKIFRSVKPNVLQVWENGKEMQQLARVNDFQSMITNQILRMTEASFRQLVVLGSKSYKPFMTLDAAERRTVIEDLLDIGVYQSMYNILKKRVATHERELETAESQLIEIQNSIETSTEYLHRISGEEGQAHIVRIEENIESLKKERDEKIEELNRLKDDDLDKKLDEADRELDDLNAAIKKFESAHHAMKIDLRNSTKEKKFFEDSDTCPKCHQGISQEIKDREIQSNSLNIDRLSSNVEKCSAMIADRESKQIAILKSISNIRSSISTRELAQSEINHTIKSIEQKEQELQELKNKSADDVAFVQKKIDEANEKRQELEERCEELKAQLRSYDHISGLLRDDGIKQQIIQTYLPLINKLVRKFLDIMEFNVDFRFDESFKETIRARGRDDFTYGNFSEGEKLRIDLCLLFTWRELSRMKNSAATNLLILDEIGESSLDENGFDCFMKILKSERDTQCSMIISHRPEKIEPHVHRVYNYTKVGNFSDLKVKDGKAIERTVL